MNKCPRCGREKLEKNQSFCQICGLRLDMKREGVIVSLKRLLDDNPLIYPCERQAIEYAITELERTAQEVPVQEQLCEINKKVNSIQICLTIYSVTLITMLITILFD